MQLLYQVDLTGNSDVDAFAAYWQSWPDVEQDVRTREFAETLVRFVLSEEARIDAAIDVAAKNWDLDRFSRVDLNLLRLAVGELLGSPEVPAPVVINEAVEIAHRFSDEKAASFINGVLDRVARDSGRLATREAPRTARSSAKPLVTGEARSAAASRPSRPAKPGGVGG